MLLAPLTGWSTGVVGLGSTRKTALVTGAAGFVGSHLVDRLLAENFEVIGLDNLMTGDLGNLEAAGRSRHFHLEIGDVREPIEVYAELIFNLACPASPVHYQSDPYATGTTSVLGAIRLVDLARMRRCRVVHASTSEIYGDPEQHPQKESYWGNVNPVGTRSCYDEGKRMAETLLFDARRTLNADVRVARIFNTYGPRMAFDDGRVISNFIMQALRGERLTVYGTGAQTRSFCFVSDLVDGLMRLARVDSLSGPINLGNPKEQTVLETATIVRELVGVEQEIEFRPMPNDDPRRRCPDIGLARELLGFEPKVAFEDGVRRTITNFQDRMRTRASFHPPPI